MNDTSAPDPTSPAPAAPAAPVLPPEPAGPPAEPGPLAPVPTEPVPGRRGATTALLSVLVVALAFGLGFGAGRATAPAGGAPASGGPTAGLPSEGRLLGRADAKITIEYWADYQCPFCAQFAEETIPALADRIEDGTIALRHRDMIVVGPESVDAAIAARCGESQGRYWAMHDALYAAQDGENQGGFSRTRLATIAQAAGLDATAFATCMDDRAVRVAVLGDTAAGRRAAVDSTPSFDVNGQRLVAPALEALLAAIDGALAGATPGTAPSPEVLPDPWDGLVAADGTVGEADAPVTVELWMDYGAAGSAGLVEALGPGLRDRVASGAVRVVRRDFAVSGDEAVLASRLVRCTARQDGPAWFVHEVLASAGGQEGVFLLDNLLNLSTRIALDVVAVDACLADPAVTAEVTAETAAGRALGLEAGPAVVVRGASGPPELFAGELDADAVLAAVDAAG